VQFYFQVSLASPAPPSYDKDNLEHVLEQGKIVFADTIENLATTITFTTTDISAAEDSSFTPLLEMVGYLAAIPLLAISPFLLLGLAVFLLPLLAGGSLILILMVLGGSVAILVPLIFGMPVLFLPLLLLAALDGEQPGLMLPEELLEGSGLSEDANMQINISDLISALTAGSPEKGANWNATSFTSSTATENVDDSVDFNEDDDVNFNEDDGVNFSEDDIVNFNETNGVNLIPHSAVPRFLSW